MVQPGSSPDDPVYYTKKDFTIGAVIEVFKHRFVITDADQYVLKHMEAREDEFPAEAIEGMRKKHAKR